MLGAQLWTLIEVFLEGLMIGAHPGGEQSSKYLDKCDMASDRRVSKGL